MTKKPMRIALKYHHEAVKAGGWLKMIENLPEGYPHIASLCALWIEAGFPALEIPAKLAAEMVFTDRDITKIENAPWDTFWLGVPAELGFSVNGLLLTFKDQEWFAGCFLETSVLTGWFNADFSKRGIEHTDLPEAKDTPPSERELQELQNLVANVLTLLTDPDNVRRRPKPSNKVLRKKNGPLAATRSTADLWELTAPVTIDLRKEAREYIETGRIPTQRSPQGVRSLVRARVTPAHWRNQPYGPNRSKVRRQLVKGYRTRPYWRGPEDAPVAVRTHRILTSNPKGAAT